MEQSQISSRSGIMQNIDNNIITTILYFRISINE